MQGGSGYHATDGAAYERFLGRWSRRLAAPLLEFAEFTGDGCLLDVGCATGSLANAMAGKWPARRIVGADIAAPYVAFARSHAASDQVVFEVADALRLPHADATFDGATAQLVLNFVSDPVVALRELQRVTASGGRVVAAVWDFRGGLVFQRMFWDTAAGIDGAAAAARDRLFSSPLALPEGLPRLFKPSVSIASSKRRSRSVWITRISTTTGSPCAAARDRWARISQGSAAIFGPASHKRSQAHTDQARPMARAR